MMAKEERQPLLRGNHTNYRTTQQQPSINDSNSSSTESLNSTNDDSTIITIKENKWIKCISRHQGQTTKKRDENGNWKYKTEILDDSGDLSNIIITESIIKIDNNEYWEKVTFLTDKTTAAERLVVELSKINFTNNTVESYKKEYINFDHYKRTTAELKTFQKIKRDLTLETQFLEGITIKAIKGINDLIINTNALNQQIRLFTESPNNNNLDALLKVYKYLTVIKNFIDESKPVATSFKNIWKRAGTLSLGLLAIYIGLTGKNLQRVVSNFPIDGKEHTLQDYTNAIFWNWENYIMVLIDTALGTFCTSAASSWARDVFFNKKSKIDPYQITEFNPEWFEQYKEIFQTLLYEENHQQLTNYFSNISKVNNLMQKFNDIETCPESEFQYHPHFTNQIKQIKNIMTSSKENIDTDIEIKEAISSINKSVKTLKTENKKPVALAKNWGYNLLVNSGLETSIWAITHIILTGSSENTSKEDFNLQDWITKDIFNTDAQLANISRYFVMRPINNIFKWGLERWGIPTNFTPKKLSKWIEKQLQYKKVLMAIPLFLAVTFIVNSVKTEAALVTEYGFEKSKKLFYEKFFRWTTLGFSIGVTAIDMIAFAISDFYRGVFNQPITIKKLATILTDCCGFTKEEKNFIEKNLAKLAKNGKLPTFDEEFAKYEEQKLEDSGIETLSQNTKSENSLTKEETGSEEEIEDLPNEQLDVDYHDINQQQSKSSTQVAIKSHSRFSMT